MCTVLRLEILMLLHGLRDDEHQRNAILTRAVDLFLENKMKDGFVADLMNDGMTEKEARKFSGFIESFAGFWNTSFTRGIYHGGGACLHESC